MMSGARETPRFRLSVPSSPTAVFATLVLAAAVLAIPAAVGPVRLNDSFWIDLVWLDQFARELANGTIYPRWLPLSHGGLGSPVFYYYPPLAFYLASLFVFAGLSDFLALVATFFVVNLLSGVGVYLWLRGQARKPIIGALMFMVAPYHLFNFYQRGAIAEVVATAILPFVLLGLRGISEGRSRSFAWTALAYAALIMSHLPLALLASVFLFAPYALMKSRLAPQPLAKIGASMALGIAAAAIYLLPAFALDPYRSSADLWSLSYLQPSSWSLWSSIAWADKTYTAVLLVNAALIVPIVSLLARYRSPWAWWALGCAVLAAGAVPLLWSLPLLSSVQFPFRLLPVAELAFVTAAALPPSRKVPWLPMWVAFLAMAGFIIAATPESANFGDRVMREFHPDVPENLPPGKRPYSWPSKWALQVAAAHRQPQFDGKITVEPTFYFPAWQVRCAGLAVPTFPTADQQLLAYQGRDCSRSIVWTAAERAGSVISLFALLLLAVVTLVRTSPSSPARRRWRPRESRLRNT
jgi:hypothetical protein